MLLFLVTTLLVGSIQGLPGDEREGKILNTFQIVRFQNNPCTGGSRNGTCFTKQECSSMGGTEDGSCAEGFGVCCTRVMGCGSTSSSQNITFIEQSSISDPSSFTSGCQYTICPCSSDVCRIRFDFTSLVLADPKTDTTTNGHTAATGDKESVGDCITDTFQIIGGSGSSSPVICGTNTGQHMYMDTDGSQCVTVVPGLGTTDTSTSRSWSIQATQYLCSEDDLGGPKGCLQYYTDTESCLVRNFGMPSSGTVGSSTTHLSNQNYEICIRRTSGSCRICYWPQTTGTSGSETDQGSFGLSVSIASNAEQAATGSNCAADYIEIPGGYISSITTNPNASGATSRYCGRFFGTNAATSSTTICTTTTPFTVNVNFDEDEVLTTSSGNPDADEAEDGTGGIVGFRLCYKQDSSNCS